MRVSILVPSMESWGRKRGRPFCGIAGISEFADAIARHQRNTRIDINSSTPADRTVKLRRDSQVPRLIEVVVLAVPPTTRIIVTVAMIVIRIVSSSVVRIVPTVIIPVVIGVVSPRRVRVSPIMITIVVVDATHGRNHEKRKNTAENELSHAFSFHLITPPIVFSPLLTYKGASAMPRQIVLLIGRVWKAFRWTA